MFGEKEMNRLVPLESISYIYIYKIVDIIHLRNKIHPTNWWPLLILGDDVHDSLLYEVHLGSDRALLDDVVSRLENLVTKLADHLRYEVGIGVCEEGERRRPAHDNCNSRSPVDEFI